jgi:hypothetical protein
LVFMFLCTSLFFYWLHLFSFWFISDSMVISPYCSWYHPMLSGTSADMFHCGSLLACFLPFCICFIQSFPSVFLPLLAIFSPFTLLGDLFSFWFSMFTFASFLFWFFYWLIPIDFDIFLQFLCEFSYSVDPSSNSILQF